MAETPVPLAEEVSHSSHPSHPNVSSSGNLQPRIDLSVLDDEDDDEDFPLIPCCTAMFLLLLSAGLIGTGSIRAYYLKSTSAGVPFWLLGIILIIPFGYYMYKTFRSCRGKNVLENRRLRKKTFSRGSSIGG